MQLPAADETNTWNKNRVAGLKNQNNQLKHTKMLKRAEGKMQNWVIILGGFFTMSDAIHYTLIRYQYKNIVYSRFKLKAIIAQSRAAFIYG